MKMNSSVLILTNPKSLAEELPECQPTGPDVLDVFLDRMAQSRVTPATVH